MGFNNHSIEPALFNVTDRFSHHDISETLKTEAFNVSHDITRLPRLMIAIDMYILKNDLGDEIYKEKCRLLGGVYK